MTDVNYIERIMDAEHPEEIHLITINLLTDCDDADQILNGMLFARGILLQELAERLFNITESPYHLINIMAIVPGLQQMAWDRLLALNPPASVFFHIFAIPRMRDLAQDEIRRLNNPNPRRS